MCIGNGSTCILDKLCIGHTLKTRDVGGYCNEIAFPDLKWWDLMGSQSAKDQVAA